MTYPAGTSVELDCGWGRLLFAHTFPDPESVARAILREEPGKRDIAFYLTDPHIVLNFAPQDLFLDPSDTYRLVLGGYREAEREPVGFIVESVRGESDLAEANRIYKSHGMVEVAFEPVLRAMKQGRLDWWVARSTDDEAVLGAVMGVDHMANFEDLENGSSLWALAVDPRAELPGIGEYLVRAVAEHYRDQGRRMLDLSVMHDNKSAVRLYRKLGFEKVAVFTVKCRNSINEKLFVGTPADHGFNPYASIIINEALRRGIVVEPLDSDRGFFRLSFGGRSVVCRESLCDMTSAIALQRCDDKQFTRDLLEAAGLSVPAQTVVEEEAQARAFLAKHGRVVVKPARGEQGQGVAVDLESIEAVQDAVKEARCWCDTVLMEAFKEGQDLRIIVINQEVVAAAVRQPPEVTGTGRHTVRELIERLSRRRSAATGGESRIPLDEETRRCLAEADRDLDSIPEPGEALQVRRTANLHTGGTIHDVTQRLHPELARAAVQAAQALEIPVVGLDLVVPAVDGPDYVIIEANERPGLANHEPQPTAERFIDFLFPHTQRVQGDFPPAPRSP